MQQTVVGITFQNFTKQNLKHREEFAKGKRNLQDQRIGCKIVREQKMHIHGSQNR